ncbi:Complex 1 protein (LYR family) [Ceratobasidium sp. AG-Ba]|nr:Complex 1 protein (LYR family) [Ceratobasidium sp. AG-Ba]
MTPTSRSTVFALYRASLRESKKLFDPLARYVFANYIRNRFRRNTGIIDEAFRYQKMNIAKTRLRHLQEANAGNKFGVAWVLRFAYGVDGPIKRQNLKIFKESCGPYDQAKQARPPAFHPALHALLSHPQVRTKINSRAQPNGPVELAARVEERGWLGKLPERREKNMWWRWWHSEITKINIPSEVEVIEETTSTAAKDETKGIAGSGTTNSVAAVKRYGVPLLKTQGLGLNRLVEQLVSNRAVPKAPKRSPRLQKSASPDPPLPKPPQNRFHRRRYRDMLVRMPSLFFKPTLDPVPVSPDASEHQQKVAKPNKIPGKYIVRISPIAATRGSPRSRVAYSVMCEEDQQWIRRSQEATQKSDTKRRS